MELAHRIGQLLIVGLPGAELDAETRELLETIQPGGVLLSKRNIENAQQVSRLNAAIRSALRVTPIIAVDQEGGRVDRLKEIFSPMPSADLLRASGDASLASRMGEIVADGLRLLGFNVNFAPVLDVAVDDSAENGLQGRYLGASVAEVIRLAGAYLEGLERLGIIGVGKHFPGLGASVTDSHATLPRVDALRDELMRRDLAPYQELFTKINARLNAVMISHAHYTAFDGPSPLPASLSKNVVTGLLREEISFKGLAITDDLAMGAIVESRSLPEAAIISIEVGNDLAMVAGTPQQVMEAWQAMVNAAQDGRITRTHISRAFDHIARVKSMLSPPHDYSQDAVSRLRGQIAEVNQALQHAR